jgi:hypothetical protein
MIGGNQSIHVSSEHLPTAAIAVEPKNSDQTLDVVVDKRVIEFGIRFFQRMRDDAVFGQEFEIDPSGTAKRSRVDAEPTEVTYDEPERFSGGRIHANKNILSMRFERDPVIDQGREKCFTSELNIPVGCDSSDEFNEASARNLPIQEGHTFLLCVEAKGVFNGRDSHGCPSVVHF